MAILCEKKTGKYYFPAAERCSGCGKEFNHNQLAVIRVIPRKKTQIFCEHCLKPLEHTGLLGQRFMGRATRVLIDNSFVVDEVTPLQMKDGQMDVWTVEKLEGKIIDHTKYAGREEFSKMDIQMIDMDEVDKQLNAPLSVKQIESFFKEKTPIIPHSNQLEDKRKEKDGKIAGSYSAQGDLSK
jgi:hypothetical protein